MISQTNKTDVLIIGGGISAIAAADRLTQLHTSWALVEASSRLGGRIWTTDKGVERGAEFLHGRNSITWEYLRRKKLKAVPYPRAKSVGRLYAFDGEFISDTKFCAEVDALVSAVERYRGPDIAVDKVIARLGEHTDPRVRFFVLDRIARLEGADTSVLSAKSLGIERQLNTAGWDNYRIEGGYERLISAFKYDGNIRLNTPITRLEWSKSGVSAFSGSNEIATARRALITVPLSILKKGIIEFNPQLPKRKQIAISGLEMGEVTKVVLRFEQPISPAFSYLSTNGLVRVWWTYQLGKETVLVGYTGGRADAAELASLKNLAVARALNELEKLFGDQVSAYYLKGEVVDWAEKPWILGAYSYTPVHALHHREALAGPIGRTLFFAGEATSTTGHVGTVTGAIESGLRAVSQIKRAE
jgi:monoamine oxidase